jgi:hypothetical protein
MKTQRRDDDAWTRLSEASFATDWDSEEDTVYDNWRELYPESPRKDRPNTRCLNELPKRVSGRGENSCHEE